MKKFKGIIVLLAILYVTMAIFSYFGIKHITVKRDRVYRIDINRLYTSIVADSEQNSQKIQDNIEKILPLKNSEIKDITYLSSTETDTEKKKAFYNDQNGMQEQVMPVWTNADETGEVVGQLKFYYNKDQVQPWKYIRITEGCLFILFTTSILLWIYVNQKIIKPFHQLSEMPFELSKGNLNDEIKEEKNRYFGKFVWGIGMLRDALDGHRRNELKLAKDKKMILLSISHDIKTPLNAINLYAKALEEEIYDTPEDKKMAVQCIQEKTKEINGFVQEIIKSSTEDVVSIEVVNSEFYLKDLVSKIRTGYEEKCRIKKTEFIIGEYENHLIKGDLDRLYEAVGNIIENAFKYGDGKKIQITFPEEDYCQLIAIYNSGTAINVNEQPHLFDSFFRGTNTEGKSGNGLGLYICKEIMKKMEGDIFANSADGGMEFVLVCRM